MEKGSDTFGQTEDEKTRAYLRLLVNDNLGQLAILVLNFSLGVFLEVLSPVWVILSITVDRISKDDLLTPPT